MMKRGMLNKRGNKRGQVTLFIIIAVVIVAVVVLFLVLRGRVDREALPDFVEPKSYIQDCAEEILEAALENITLQGGYLIPPESPFYFPYPNGIDDKIGCLCYSTSGECEPLVIPYVLVKTEISKISDSVNNCIEDAITQIEAQGKEVTAGDFSFDVNITPGHVNLFIRRPITVKNEATLAYENFDISYPSAMSTFMTITQDIVNEESKGDFKVDDYLERKPYQVYIKKDDTYFATDHTIIYNITTIDTKETFLFAIKEA